MQKRSFPECSVTYSELSFPDDFPVSCSKHIQKYRSGDSLHFHNILEIGYCYQGSGLFFVDNNIIPFSKGDVSFILPDQPHIAQSPAENPSYWSFVSVDTDRMFCDNAGYKAAAPIVYFRRSAPSILSKSEHENVTEIVRLIIDEMEKQPTNYRLTVKNLLLVLLLMIGRLCQEGNIEKYEDGQTAGNILQVSPSIYFISTHYQESICTEQLAMMCNLSNTHFRRVFKRSMGYTPSEYLMKVRMDMAASMLKSTSSAIAEVAVSVGYDTLSSFNRNFQKRFHLSPRDYRNQFNSTR